MSKHLNALFEKRGHARERRAIRKAIRAVRRHHVTERDREQGDGFPFEWRSRIIQGIDEALRAITRHARGR